MTTAQRTTIAQIEATHEAERFTASQAAREVAQLDPRSVLVAIQVKLDEGRYDEAKQMYLDWKKGN